MSLTLALQFPMGRYAAASWSDKDTVEWPPHPARLCLGLLDALHKAGNPADERSALEWLCEQLPPSVVVPNKGEADIRLISGVFVPQNPSVAGSISHPRKARSFPVVYLNPDIPTVYFHWKETTVSQDMENLLSRLLGRLPRLGHSSSLVQVGIGELPDSSVDRRLFRPVEIDENEISADIQLRIPWAGLVQSAEDSFAAADRSKEMACLIGAAEKKAKPDKALKPVASPRGRHDPRHQWWGYVEHTKVATIETPWHKNVVLFKIESGTRLGVLSTWQVTEVLHKTLLDRWCRDLSRGSIPSWISGHVAGSVNESTAPLRQCHLAIFPLPFVGGEHADGHLLGFGFALPKPAEIGLTPAQLRIDWRNAMSALLGDDAKLELVASDGSWRVTLVPVASPVPPQALTVRRWTQPSRVWQSATPIILHRHPKPHFKKDPVAWKESCKAILRESCQQLKLPEPSEIDVSIMSVLEGVPASAAFVAPKTRPGRPPRYHIHASFLFPEPVAGPLLLGAGRYRGYGLCVPCVDFEIQPDSDHVAP